MTDLPILTDPAGGTPGIVDTEAGLAAAAAKLAAGTGPIAVDAERASGIRYGQRCFLAQFKREGAGIFLIDAETLRTSGVSFAPLAEVLAEPEWILHSAMQDLPCLAELGLRPSAVFDTELAARLAGFEKFGLASVVERTLGIGLAKEHSNSDWSRRPIPLPWLTYAALDVEVLLDVREHLIVELAAQGKLEWAYQEFEHLVAQGLPKPKTDPWRKTSGLNTLKSRKQLSMARELWRAREHLAEHKDVSPGHLIPDSAIVAAVKAQPSTVPALLKTHGFHGRFAQREAPRWLRALQQGAASEDFPPLRAEREPGLSQPRSWESRHPEAFARHSHARPVIAWMAAEHHMPPENLLQPAVLRAVAWHAPARATTATVAALLTEHGARPWQVGLAAEPMAKAFAAAERGDEPDPMPEREPAEAAVARPDRSATSVAQDAGSPALHPHATGE
jgi:ribonuclease D